MKISFKGKNIDVAEKLGNILIKKGLAKEIVKKRKNGKSNK